MCCVYYVKQSLAEMTHLSKLALKAHSSNTELWSACLVTPWCDICPYIQRCWLTPKCPKRLLWVQQEWSHHPRTPFEPGHGSRKKPAAAPPGIHWKLTAWTPCCSQGTSFSGPAWEFGGDYEIGGVELPPVFVAPSFTTSTILYRVVWWKKTGDQGRNFHPLL